MTVYLPFFNTHGQLIMASIPSQIIMAYLPLVFRLIGLCSLKKNFDNAHPRLYLAALENEALMNDKKAKFVLRCQACHLNSVEDCIIWWPAALVALSYSGISLMAMSLSAIHLGLRFFYIFLYCFIDNKAASYIRSIVWVMGWACPLIMLFEATNNVAT